jgi:hypothetical protein
MMNRKNNQIFFVIFYNVLASITLYSNEISLISLNLIYVRLLFLLLIIWNVYLIYLIRKTKEK